MDSIVFREYQESDNPFVSNALCEIEKIEKDQLTSLKIVDDFHQKISMWVEQLNATPNNLIIIAEQNQKPCGFIMAIVEMQPNQFTQYITHGLIQAIWVDPDKRKKGLGESLVKQALDSFSEFKIPYCDIAYHPDNIAAKNFWVKMGFNQSQTTSRKFLNSRL